MRDVIRVGSVMVPFGPGLLFDALDVPGLFCMSRSGEDMFVPIPPSAQASLAGATVLCNLSGSPITIGRAEDRHLLARFGVRPLSRGVRARRGGRGESSTDLAWDGQTMIYENGRLLAESERFPRSERRSVADVDVGDCARNDCGWAPSTTIVVTTGMPSGHSAGSNSGSSRHPVTSVCGVLSSGSLVPSDALRLQQDCYEGYSIQVSGLEQRLRAPEIPKVVIGVSGGLDSTHALLGRREGDGPGGTTA